MLCDKHQSNDTETTKKTIVIPKRKERERYKQLGKDVSGTQLVFDQQLTAINKMYLDENLEGSSDKVLNEMRREITNKINGYKQQDIKKKRHDESKLITFDDTIEKLVASKLCCYYCKCHVYIVYQDVRQNDQWSLDRIDNSIGHFKDNVIVACLECNLKRRRMNDQRFKFSKSFGTTIKKLE